MTGSTRKQSKAIGGTAGRKRRRLKEERACNEKAVPFKVKYLNVTAPPAEPRPQPAVVLPPANNVVMASSDDDDDFEI